MNSRRGPEVLPDVAAAAIELYRRGLPAPEPGWAAIMLAVVEAAETVHPELRVVARAKWGELKVAFLPEDLADTLKVRLARAVISANASRETCQVCGRPAAVGGVEWDREIVEVLCAEHRAVADAGRSR